MICDFSDAMRLGFRQALCEIFDIEDDDCDLEAIYAFCQVHFQRSAYRVQQNYEIVPSHRGSEFKWLVLQLIDVNKTPLQFEETINTLRKEFPKCQSWLNWYLHNDRAKMIFQAIAENKFTQSEPNTNAQESFGRTLQLSSEFTRISIKDALHHCYRMALKCDVQYVNAREGKHVNYGLQRERKKAYVNDGIPPEHRRRGGTGRKKTKQTVLNFSHEHDVTTKEHSPKKHSIHHDKLAKYEDVAMPWSFHSCTPDSGGKQIRITNTCAYDTVLMALYWLRKYDKTLGPIIRDEGELLNVVLDNIERKNHAEARLAWISHCEQCNAATVARNYDPEDTRTAIKWNYDGMVTDCIKPMSMFKMKVEHIFEPCRQGDACPNLNLNGGTHKGTHHLIYASMKDMHQIQQEQIDKCYHSGVDMKCGEEIGSCLNVDTNCDEVPARSACKGVRKMRKDIETLPPVVVIQNDDLDYNNCKVTCMNDIERRLLIQGKYYLLIQVNLYGGPRHFRGITK